MDSGRLRRRDPPRLHRGEPGPLRPGGFLVQGAPSFPTCREKARAPREGPPKKGREAAQDPEGCKKVKLRLLAVGRLRNPAYLELVQSYAERLKSFVHLRVEEVKDFPVRKGMSVKVAIDVEGQALTERLLDGSVYFALDERGKQKSSEDFAELFRRLENQSPKEVTFVIGGGYGVSDLFFLSAKERLSLSKLTFPHELAGLVFLEQVYRAYTILRGIPYHHGDVN